jgi:hypothetical protein
MIAEKPEGHGSRRIFADKENKRLAGEVGAEMRKPGYFVRIIL